MGLRPATVGALCALMSCVTAQGGDAGCGGKGVAVLVRCAGTLRESRLSLLAAYAADLRGVADVWVQYDTTCGSFARVSRAAKCRRLSTQGEANLTFLASRHANLQVHVTNTTAVLEAFPQIAANWADGERFREWGDLGRQQHETFVASWWRSTSASARYHSVWVLEDDVRFGGSVRDFVLRHEADHGPCSPAHVHYAAAQFKPTFEATGSVYLQSQWMHWTKASRASAPFRAAVPQSAWVRKVEYVEKMSDRVVALVEVALHAGQFAFGEFFVSSLCRARGAWCTMLDIACCPPTASFEYLKQCTYSGLPSGVPKHAVRDCVALRVKHWVERITREAWVQRGMNGTNRWQHPIKW
mmetsp:Transcript_11574/g.34347  ORF Transcript_11574/g.34347 Transcript_11574/m.34347 type:complete len:356 (-) Transcript_11574:143-1210(-)